MRAEDHEVLRRTGRGTPMGDFLRLYWTPVALSSELPEPAGPPVRVRVLGENLIAFRTGAGRVGLVGEHCAHRGASLYFGRVEGDGIRCAYHGWKFCPVGSCLEMPNVAPDADFQQQIRQIAYPCEERGGVVFAWLGDAAAKPELPALEFLTVPLSHVYVSKREQECHWTQGMDGDFDPSHVPILHASVLGGPKPANAQAQARDAWQQLAAGTLAPTIESNATNYGILYASRRAAGAQEYYYRIAQWFMPWYTTIPAWTGDGPLAGHAWVPVDDGNCMVFSWTWHPTRALSDEDRRYMLTRADGVYSELAPGSFKPLRNKSNFYTTPGEAPDPYPYKRLKHFQDQDMAITESMGPIYDRTKENLAASDLLIVQTRRRLVDAARDAQRGKPPAYDADAYAARPLSVRMKREASDWRTTFAENLRADPATFIASA